MITSEKDKITRLIIVKITDTSHFYHYLSTFFIRIIEDYNVYPIFQMT